MLMGIFPCVANSSIPKLKLQYNFDIPCTRSYPETLQSSTGDLPFNIDQIRPSIRGTLFSISNRLSTTSDINLSTLVKLYITCVLPRELYSSELWNEEIQTCCRHAETRSNPLLLSGTRSKTVTGLVSKPLEAYIGLQKLTFLGIQYRCSPVYFHSDYSRTILMLETNNIASSKT